MRRIALVVAIVLSAVMAAPVAAQPIPPSCSFSPNEFTLLPNGLQVVNQSVTGELVASQVLSVLGGTPQLFNSPQQLFNDEDAFTFAFVTETVIPFLGATYTPGMQIVFSNVVGDAFGVGEVACSFTMTVGEAPAPTTTTTVAPTTTTTAAPVTPAVVTPRFTG
jgi:hypothetical protein